MKVPFADLRTLDQTVHGNVAEVLNSGRFIHGPEVEEFEQIWAHYCHAAYCVGTKSGTAALTMALRAALPEGSNVIIPEYSFAATLFAVLEARMVPIFVPVTVTGLIDLDAASEEIESLTRRGVVGLVVVHLYGQIVKIPKEILNNENVIVIEDACQAHGTTLQGKAACFSFYPSKNLGAAGDAGAVVTNSGEFARSVYQLCNYGDERRQKYQHLIAGINERMDTIQAAVLLAKVTGLDAANAQRRWVASQYAPATIATTTNNYFHLYPILVESSHVKQVMATLKEHGVETGRHYPYTLSKLYGVPESPIAARLARSVVSLPIGPHLNTAQVDFVNTVFDAEFELTATGWICGESLSSSGGLYSSSMHDPSIPFLTQ